MARDANVVLLTGRIGTAPETRELSSGTTVGKCSLAVNRYAGPEKGEETMWVYLNFWGTGTKVLEYVKVGQKVTVTGRLKIDKGKDDKTYVSVDVDTLILPDKGSESSAGNRTRSTRDEPPF